MVPWSIPRPWKGKTCEVNAYPRGSEVQVDLWLLKPDGSRVNTFFPDYSVIDPSAKEGLSLNAGFVLFTDERHADADSRYTGGWGINGHNPTPDQSPGARYVGEGVANGLEERRDHLPGRFLLHKAIGLAVHLGASRVLLTGTGHVSPRVRRALDTLVRPLKSHRVDVWDPAGNTPFAKEPRQCQ